MSEVGSPLGLKILADLLGYDGRLDPVLLSYIGRAAKNAPRPIDGRILERVRPFLQDEDARLVREAALAVGKLEDFESVDLLIELLGSDNRSVADNAHGSLKSMTGLGLPPRTERWSLWLRSERRWLDEEAPRVFEKLRSRESAHVVAALSALSKRRFKRDEIAVRVEPVLRHEDPAIRRLGCIALRQLGASSAVPALIDCLDDPDTTVARNAWVTLCTITGETLPPDRREWSERFPPGDRS